MVTIQKTPDFGCLHGDLKMLKRYFIMYRYSLKDVEDPGAGEIHVHRKSFKTAEAAEAEAKKLNDELQQIPAFQESNMIGRYVVGEIEFS